MIQTDKRPNKKNDFAFIYRNSVWENCPNGQTTFFAVADFTDESSCFYQQIFAESRAQAYKIALDFFADCYEYIRDISIQESQK